jgi:hypothetical protein
MIFTEESVKPQIAQLLQKYPKLVVVQSNSQMVRLHGHILVHRTFNDFPLRKTYTLDIVIPINSDELPYVVDTDRQIRQDYHHYYPNGKLCLATDSQMRIRFNDGFDLVSWVFEFVEVYYYSYEYFERFGIFPFGERAHDIWGIIQTYQDILSAKDVTETCKLMSFIKSQKYRGHHPCPCGSGKVLRTCHGHTMLNFYKDDHIKKVLIDDLDTIMRKVAENEQYRKKAK